MDSRDWKAGGDEPSEPSAGAPDASAPLPPHLDPRQPRGGVPPRPPRSMPPRPAASPSRQVVPATPPPGRRTATRVLSWLAVVTSVAVLASALGGYLLLNHYDGNLNRIAGLGLRDDRPADLPRDAKNILIVGSDSRGDLAPGEGTQGTGDTFVTGGRADTIILAHLYGGADQAQLVSFPRDTWLEIPDYINPDTDQAVPAHDAKINSAFFEGGPALLIDTVEALTGVYIDHYVQVDFEGFQTIVNRLDGVEVCLPVAAKEKDSGIDLEAGRQTIKGDQALAFVRQRKGLPNGDIDRIARQQQFIGAIVRKILSPSTLLNPLKLNGVITDTISSLDVDENLGIGDLQDLALRMRNFNAGGVIFSTVPIENQAGRRQGQSVVLLDEAALEVMFDRIRRDVAPGTPDDAPTETPTQLVVAPGDVRVQVFNGGGVSGQARVAYDDLEQLGFQLVGQPGNRGNGAASTVVFYGPDRADSARTLAAAIPGATIELDATLDRTLDVVIGADYDGAVAVAVGETPAAASPAPAASAPPVNTAEVDPCAV